MLTKLLVIRMVASTVRGFSFSVSSRFAEAVDSSSSSAKSVGLSEKKATSDPEISAEEITKNISDMVENMVLESMKNTKALTKNRNGSDGGSDPKIGC